MTYKVVHFSLLTDWVVGGGWWDMREDFAEILFQSFLQEAIVSSSDMGKDVSPVMLSIQHFFCRLRRPLLPLSKVP